MSPNHLAINILGQLGKEKPSRTSYCVLEGSGRLLMGLDYQAEGLNKDRTYTFGMQNFTPEKGLEMVHIYLDGF